MRRVPALAVAVAVLGALVAGCSGDDDQTTDPTSESSTPSDGAADDGGAPADVSATYLDYLADGTDEHLASVRDGTDDEVALDAIDRILATEDAGELLAAIETLDGWARQRCQGAWTADTQGAGSSAAAAQALFDAVVAGDRAGAANVAAANALATFEPWEPVVADQAVGSPALVDVAEDGFTMVLGPAEVVHCEVETGVVLGCLIAE